MRSFASALSLARGGRSDNSPDASAHPVPTALPHLAKARSTSLLAKAPRTPVETSVSVLSRPALTPGSSCSSDGSASLQTPEDETVMPPFPKSDGKKRWSTWFGFRKQLEKGSLLGPEQIDSAPPRPLSAGSKGQTTDRPPVRPLPTQSSSESDEDDEQSSSESFNGPRHSTVIRHRSVPSRAMVAQSRTNLRTLLRNSLNRSPLPPPLVETPSTLFPRSSAPLHGPHQTLSLESTMHVRKMLWRLDHRTLSDSEVQSIMSLARRPQPKEASRNSRIERRTDDDIIAYATMRVGRYSRGLRKWASRPCFEQRFLVWMPDEKGNVSCKGVMGVDRGLAVYDLEYSEGLEALAGLDLDDDTFERSLFPLPPPPPKKPSLNPISQSQARPGKTARKPPFQRTSSPLRIDHSAPAEPVLSTISPISSVTTDSPISAPILDAKIAETSREACRSAPKDDLSHIDHSRGNAESDETIPLGYMLQIKKRREEKTRFLQAEREKRAKEIAGREVEEGQKRDAGQRRALEGQNRREVERRRIEEEKKAREEKLKEKYNEEVAASRQRRENARLGVDNYTNIREMHQKQNERTYSRPAYDPTPPPVHPPRRNTSDAVTPGEGFTNAVSSSNPRPPSIVESSRDKRRSIVPSSRNFKHPSSEDARSNSQRRQSLGRDTPQQSQHQYPSRPLSVVSSSSRPASVLRTQSSPNQVPLLAYPMMPVMPQMTAFVPMNQVPSLPPMPPMPVWNMPLLPPNAPFMRQPHSRSPSPGSSPHSRNDSPPSSPSRRQSTLLSPSPSHRRAGLQASSSSSARTNNAGSRPPTSPLSREPGGGNRSQPRSMSYPALPPSASRPMHRDDRSQSTRRGSSTNIANMDSKRRTSMM